VALLGATSLAGQQRYEFEEYTLPNGLRVILSENHSAAVVAVNIWYNVGSRNERQGRSGFAHLFEHMMFQGSQNVTKGEHMQLIERAGGSMNGTTNEDRTAYFETMPSNRLNLALWLEADRMRSLTITDDNFENQRETVKEERRLRVDNQPYGKAFSDGFTLPFDSSTCFPYAHTVIGSMDDLDAAETADVQEFFDLYYAPNNATLVIVGDFDPARVKGMIADYFGDIARGAEPAAVECASAFGSLGKTRVFEDEHANLPAAGVVFLTPAHPHPDSPALSLLGDIMGSGESSRLNVALVRDKKSALQAFLGVDSRRGAGLVLALAIANQGVDIDTLTAQLKAEIARAITEGVTAEELEKAKNSFRSGQVFGRQTAFGMANSFQHYAHYHQSVAEINTDIENYMAVTRDDIQRVASTYLVPENSYTIVVVPKQATGSEGGDR
jgi:predicted Zn-dependent peptidase